MQMDSEFVKNKLMNLQDKSTRNNLKMHRVTETNDETCEKCEEHVGQVFSEKLGLKNISVEREHRLKRRKGDKSQKTRTIISNLLSFKEKKISRKGKNIFIDEDYSFETMQFWKKLWDEVKYLRSQADIA